METKTKTQSDQNPKTKKKQILTTEIDDVRGHAAVPQQRGQLGRADPNRAPHQPPPELLGPLRVEPGLPSRLDPPRDAGHRRHAPGAAKQRRAQPGRVPGQEQVGRDHLRVAVAAAPPAVAGGGGKVARGAGQVDERPQGGGLALLLLQLLLAQGAREQGDGVGSWGLERAEARRGGVWER